MVNHDQQDTGVPTRAIHESYLRMQHAHREYRRARDNDEDTHRPQGQFQDAVLTFYELIRPYLKEESELTAYWNGRIPPYPDTLHQSSDEAMRYYEDSGIGVYQIQQHVNHTELNQQVLTDGGADMPATPVQWHEVLNRPRTSRLIAIQRNQTRVFFREFRFAVLGLRELDRWQATFVTEREHGDGFMSGETRNHRRREFEPAVKITQAKRMLTETANKLGTLPKFQIDDPRDAEFTYSDLLEGDQE